MNAEPVSPRVVVFTGLPGTGKSTLADAAAVDLGVPAFAGDWLLGALAPSRVLHGLDREESLRLYRRLLFTLALRQAMLGQSAILDCLVTDEVANEWRERLAEHGARLRLVECVCSDEALHRTRLEGRRRDIPGWHEVGWDHVERMRAEFPPLSLDRLVLDSVDPFNDNLRTVLDFFADSIRPSQG